MKPHLAFAVENKLSEDANAPQLKVDLVLQEPTDFEPENVVKQVALRADGLRTKSATPRSLQGNDKLEEAFGAVGDQTSSTS
jgi:type VI secretion system protein ImpB